MIVLLLLAAGVFALLWSMRTQRQTGLPQGAVIYSDTGAERAVMEPLVSYRYGLVGKPDYLVEVTHAGSKLVIPLEVKSRKRPVQPSAGHVLQLATYCLLVEDRFGQRPPYGYLRYADATLSIPFTDELRRQVLEAAQAIRRARTATQVARSHEDPARCAGCGYRESCGTSALGADSGGAKRNV